MALRYPRSFAVKFGCRPPRCASVSLWLKLGEKRRGRRAKKKKNRFLRALCASARVQAFQVLVAVCPSVQSFAENSAFSAKFVLLRFLCVLQFIRTKGRSDRSQTINFCSFARQTWRALVRAGCFFALAGTRFTDKLPEGGGSAPPDRSPFQGPKVKKTRSQATDEHRWAQTKEAF